MSGQPRRASAAPGVAPSGPCQRDLADQLRDRSGAVRRIDHPRTSVRRLDLLADPELDVLRERHEERAEMAMDVHDALLDQLDCAALPQDEVLELHCQTKPILAVHVCLACGAHDIALAARAWSVDRAMRRTALGERDILAIAGLLASACGDDSPSLDALSAEALVEIAQGVGQDLDLPTLRARVIDLATPLRDVAHRA